MNTAIIELQRDLLLNQLMEVENHPILTRETEFKTFKSFSVNTTNWINPISSNLFLKGVIKATPFTKNLDYQFNLPEREAHNRRHILGIYETMAVLMDKGIWKLYKTESERQNRFNTK